MTDHTLPDRLRALAESLVGDEWEHPIDAVETCRRAADELERLDNELTSMSDAALDVFCKMAVENNRK